MNAAKKIAISLISTLVFGIALRAGFAAEQEAAGR